MAPANWPREINNQFSMNIIIQTWQTVGRTVPSIGPGKKKRELEGHLKSDWNKVKLEGI